MVRRIKEDLRVIQGGFPKRKVEQITLSDPPEAPELKLFALLSQYQELHDERLKTESRRTQNASGLVLCHLQQRLFSSIEAFARTLKVHRRTIERQRETRPTAVSAKHCDDLNVAAVSDRTIKASQVFGVRKQDSF
jgi:hypothetical protein